MEQEGYITEQAVVNRKIQLPFVIEKLTLVFNFFDTYKRLPESNKKDKNEMKLYNFFRKLDINKYKDDLPKEYLEKIEYMKMRSEIVKERRKRKEKLANKRNYITKCINDYYNFYIENGKFASDCNYKTREEKSICKNYNCIIKYKDIFTKEQALKVNMINQIKTHRRNLDKIVWIKRYINFCYLNGVQPKFKKEDKDCVDSYVLNEFKLSNNIYNLDLNNLYIPYNLLEEFYDAISFCNENYFNSWKENLNNCMKEVLDFLDENQVSADSKLFYNYKVTGIFGKPELISSAIAYLKQYSKYLDDDLINKYNSYTFLRKPIDK